MIEAVATWFMLLFFGIVLVVLSESFSGFLIYLIEKVKDFFSSVNDNFWR